MNECTIYFIIKFTERIVKSAFNPIAAFFLALMVNARHLFYGLSMLEKYKNTGWKKPYLIFGMCDESFTINSAVTPPEDVDKGWFMFFVNLLNQIYWVFGATMGALLGYVIHFNTEGIEFVMTALFVVMLVNQWEEHKDHRPALIGLICPVICLMIFGGDNFMIPFHDSYDGKLPCRKKIYGYGGGRKMTIAQQIITIVAVMLGTILYMALVQMVFETIQF